MISIELRDDRSEKIPYDYPDYPIYNRRGMLSLYPNYAAPSHWHDDVELIAVLDGEMDYNVNGGIIKLQKGEGIFINARQMHYGFSDSRMECHFICVILHPLLLCAVPAFEQEFVLPVVCGDRMPFLFLDPKICWQQDILEQIRFMDQVKGERAGPLKIQSAFFRIWSVLYEHVPQDSKNTKLQNNDLTITKNMVGFIQKNYNRKISLADIAMSGAVGQSKCCKLFAKYLGQTPNACLILYRLNKSTELLRDTDMPVTEIALSVGFGSASYYAETFRKWFGESPTQFRAHTVISI